MGTLRVRVSDWWGERPWVDLVPAVVAAGSAAAVFPRISTSVESLPEFLTGVAGLSGLILAAATLAFQMMSQSSNVLLQGLVRKHRRTLNRNWRSILLSTIICGGTALLLILLAEQAPRAVVSVGTALLVLVSVRGLRATHWFILMNAADEVADQIPEPLPLPKVVLPPEKYPIAKTG